MKDKNVINILGVEVDNVTVDDVLEYLETVNSKQSTVNSQKEKIIQIITVNPEIVILAKESPEYKKILNRVQIRVADGIGIILAGKILGKNFKQRITGLALTKKLCELGAEKGFLIGLIGGGSNIAVKCGECLEKMYPKLKWWGEGGPNIKVQRSKIKTQIKTKIQNSKRTNKKLLNFSITQFLDAKNEKQTYNFNTLIDRINYTRTSVLFCAFGAPKQEYFINELRKYESKLKQPLVVMGVGGVFDELTGNVSPAPAWIDRVGLKWLWRLIHEPWRWKRQVKLLKFLYLVLTS